MSHRNKRPNAPAWWMHPGWCTGLLVFALVAMCVMTSALFTGAFRTYVEVTLRSDRAGLIMEPGGKVRMRGLQVGQVARVDANPVSLTLQIDPEMVEYIPANV